MRLTVDAASGIWVKALRTSAADGTIGTRCRRIVVDDSQRVPIGLTAIRLT
ncbi:MAG: hypothetical protein M3O32_05540 [Actinomycetota bacterium]|nr:hypothetical protein [Actinomycetota bacterium]